MRIIRLPSELVPDGSCIDCCNAAHRNSFGRIWCAAMSHGDKVCLLSGEDLTARLERVRQEQEEQQTDGDE